MIIVFNKLFIQHRAQSFLWRIWICGLEAIKLQMQCYSLTCTVYIEQSKAYFLPDTMQTLKNADSLNMQVL